MKKPINREVMADLKRLAWEAYENGHYLTGAIIEFQVLEVILRIAISGCAKGQGVSKDVLTRMEKQQNFALLIDFFGLVAPDNGFSVRLRSLNQKRNDLVHNLLTEYESVDVVNAAAKQLWNESVEMVFSISKYLFSDDKEVRITRNSGGNPPDVV